MHDIPIMMFHSINDHPKESPMGSLAASSKALDAHLKMFKKWKYQMISIDDLINKRYDENKPYAVLTFDDGFKDNLTVAMPILKKHGARATIYINPAYLSEESEKDSDWGFMTWDEVKAAQASGIFDIQAHTMTHEFIFTSDKVVDYYTPDKFDKYYWLAWMLFPNSPRAWNSTAYSYRDKIPTGYPIFEYGRRLASPKFTPAQEYVNFLIEQYNDQNKNETEFNGSHGVYETHEDFISYAKWEIGECKNVLENELGTEVNALCFPGHGYADEMVDIARKLGYKCYNKAANIFCTGNNNDNVKLLYEENFAGLNRISFSYKHIKGIPDGFLNYWVAKISLGSFQRMKPYPFLKRFLKSLKR